MRSISCKNFRELNNAISATKKQIEKNGPIHSGDFAVDCNNENEFQINRETIKLLKF